MNDLAWAALAVGLISALSFVFGMRLASLGTRWPGIAAMVGGGLLFGAYFFFVRDSVLLLRLVPVSSVPIAGDPAPWIAALCAGVLAGQRAVPWLRRGLFAVLLIGIGWHGPVSALAQPAPETGDFWFDGVCMQTTDTSCGPAALVTLLKHHGVETREGEMARLCLTSEAGTHLTGLYRGLALRSPNGMKPRARRTSIDTLRNNPHFLPAVVSLELSPELAAADPRYTEDWGWDVGVMHTVVLIGFEPGNRVVIADPGAGLERWSVQGMRELWTGEVLYLEPVE